MGKYALLMYMSELTRQAEAAHVELIWQNVHPEAI